MACTVNYQSIVNIDETIDVNAPAVVAANGVIRHTLYSTTQTLNGSTGVPVTKDAVFQKSLSAGAGTIDLTALPGANNGTVNFTGLKVQVMKLRALPGNANPITVAKGAANGYGLDGAGAAWSITLDPGMEALVYGNDKSPDVAAGARVLDLTGTGTQGLEVTLAAG